MRPIFIKQKEVKYHAEQVGSGYGNKQVLLPIIKKHCIKDCILYSDCWKAYINLSAFPAKSHIQDEQKNIYHFGNESGELQRSSLESISQREICITIQKSFELQKQY
ncbi:hypothetical protein ABPG72_015353 [Tetrahymena utriculariae]